jgi:xanthine dehydrogenase accessory factor
MPENNPLILLRGGGDLASGVALRLYRCGLKLVIAELAQPLAVRRAVSFAEAVFEDEHTVEGVSARLVKRDQLSAALESGVIPVIVDADADILSLLPFLVVIDARLIKQAPAPLPSPVPLHIGVGPGFHAGQDCDAVIETRRSHTLGRVYWHGTTQADSGQPEGDPRRVLRAPVDGVLLASRKIGEHVEEGEVIARINDQYPVFSEIKGVLRGIIRDGSTVTKRLKIGDVDPRDNEAACYLVSDKALAIGGGVLEAVLHRKEIREQLWG